MRDAHLFVGGEVDSVSEDDPHLLVGADIDLVTTNCLVFGLGCILKTLARL